MNRFIKSVSNQFLVFVLVIAVVLAAHILVKNQVWRFDLTDEQEYSLSESTLTILGRIDDRLTIKLYFTKDVPAAFLPIKNQIMDVLAEYQAHAKEDIIIETIDPSFNDEIEKQAIALGMQPVVVQAREQDRTEEKKIFLGLAMYYKDKREVLPVVGHVQNLEYALDLQILRMTTEKMPRIGLYIGDHLKNYQQFAEAVKSLGQVERISANDTKLVAKDFKLFLLVEPVGADEKFWKQIDESIADGASVALFTSRFDIKAGMQAEPLDLGGAFDDWLAAKGIELTSRVLTEPRNNVQAPFQMGMLKVFRPYPFWAHIKKPNLSEKNPVTSGLEDLLFPWGSVIEKLDGSDSNWEMTPLAWSSDDSFLLPETETLFDLDAIDRLEEMPKLLSQPVSVLLSSTSDDGSGQIYVTGSQHVVADQYLGMSRSNGQFIANVLEIASWGNHLIGVRTRGKTNRPFMPSLSDGQRRAIKWSMMIGSPVVLIVCGVLWLAALKQRRRRFIAGLARA